jgi:hypothetical protein
MEENMSKFSDRLFLPLLVMMSFSFPYPAFAATQSKTIPTFSIVSVRRDTAVTITTYNFPAYDNFDVLMNYIGTRGIGGIKVANIYSGSGGSQTFTFSIPPALYGQNQIAIRLQSNTGSGYFAYNWFYNKISGGGTGGRGDYYPIFRIASVVRDQSVTVVTHNLPVNDTFRVRMGSMGTHGINGFPVTVFNTGGGGSQTLTFSIPSTLYGAHQISIRMESTTGSGYYAFNWFYNNTAY